MAINDITPGIDDAWRTRIPPGWVQLPDGSWGPPVPGQPVQLPGATPPAPVGSTFIPGDHPNVGQINPPAATRGLTLNGGPDVIPPQGSNVGTGKEVGPWTNSFTDATGQPQYLDEAGAFDPWSLLNKLGLPGMAAAGILHTTPAETGEMPRQTLGRKPSGPAPFVQPQHPSTMRFPMWPTPPASAPDSASTLPANVPLPPVRPKAAPKGGRIDPATVNLGRGAPFTTLQYDVPGTVGAGRGRGPIITALDFSKLFGGRS